MMKKITLTFIVYIFKTTLCFGQDINSNTLFEKGIYVENLKIMLPWEINFSEIKKYANPVIIKDPSHSKMVQIKWDSVKILNRFTLNLFILEPNKFINKNVLKRVIVYKAVIDSITAKELISFFVQLTNRAGIYKNKKKESFNRWVINNCSVTVGYNKNKEYFLAISKIN